MRVLVFGHRQDETGIFAECNKEYQYEIDFTSDILTMDNVDCTKGYEAIIIIVACKITSEIAKGLKENGVKYILTRAAGKDHLDKQAIQENGLLAANVPAYSPNAISEHTVMLILAVLRKLKLQMSRIANRNFMLTTLRSKELRDMTVGIIGTGRIGATTIQNLSGFGCKMIAYDLYENEKVRSFVTYVPKEELFKKSDIIVLHCPSTKENYHMINAETIQQMKPGVILINTARGDLVDTKVVLEALKSGYMSGLGLDVYEHESNVSKRDFHGESTKDPILEELLSMEQALFTTHTAFYTDEAVGNMIGYSLDNLNDFIITGTCKNSI